MDKFLKNIKDFYNNEDGLSAVEYVIAGGVLLVGIAAIFSSLEEAVSTEMGTITTKMAE
ncbi:Flp family type IVb pilin [Vibrio maerlii]|uniref:Flp family type IVb pilin n=1 Tax=Vibrio maerlii TaxID=2231648 RepID=UPI000E3BECE5|nr:Flp family type IVb pilin [Vibrio maerlii]